MAITKGEEESRFPEINKYSIVTTKIGKKKLEISFIV
jgi:hypothetical protein